MTPKEKKELIEKLWQIRREGVFVDWEKVKETL